MRKSKLGLDFDKVDKAKGFAKQIADGVQQFVNKHTTVAVERTLCRLLGIDGVDVHDVPLPNVVVNQIQEAGLLSQGVVYYLGNAILETGLKPQEIAEKIANGELDITRLPIHSMKRFIKQLRLMWIKLWSALTAMWLAEISI